MTGDRIHVCDFDRDSEGENDLVTWSILILRVQTHVRAHKDSIDVNKILYCKEFIQKCLFDLVKCTFVAI